MEVGVNLPESLQVEILDPRSVVERLGDHVSRSPVALEFEHMDSALDVESKEIDEAAIVGPRLSADDEKIGPGHGGGILGHHVLETVLSVHRGRRQRRGFVALHPPDRHLDRHDRRLRWRLAQLLRPALGLRP